MTRTDIINKLIDIYGYTNYLEIGVDNPKINFDLIKCRSKTGVDPAVKRTSGVHAVTSDMFFLTCREKFDIIFIDGLHEHEQVITDITNALAHLSPNGTIVVHDCNPTTEIMQAVPRKQGIWTGDVWRAWLHFRNSPNLSMHVLDTDYGVGIIRRGKQDNPIKDSTGILYHQFERAKEHLLNLVPVELEPISVCIPAFEQYGFGAHTLSALLETLINQKGVEFEIVVSDNAKDNSIKAVCDRYPGVKRFKNELRGIAENINNAMDKAENWSIKPMFQDDLLLSSTALADIAFALKFNKWVTCAGFSINEHGKAGKTRLPMYSPSILRGQNTIGMPSVIAHDFNDGILYDTKLRTLVDCDFYYQLHKAYGNPGVIKKKLIGSRYWDNSTSRKQGDLRPKEVPYLMKKYKYDTINN